MRKTVEKDFSEYLGCQVVDGMSAHDINELVRGDWPLHCRSQGMPWVVDSSDVYSFICWGTNVMGMASREYKGINTHWSFQ